MGHEPADAQFDSVSDGSLELDENEVATYRDFLAANGIPGDDVNVEMLKTMMEALGVFQSRNSIYGNLWQRQGWLQTASALGNKIHRIMYKYWTCEKNDGDVDDVLDGINFATMLVILLRGARIGRFNKKGLLW